MQIHAQNLSLNWDESLEEQAIFLWVIIFYPCHALQHNIEELAHVYAQQENKPIFLKQF